MRSLLCVSVLAASTLFGADHAWASKTLDEPRDIQRRVRKVPAAERQAAWKAVGVEVGCSQDVLFSPGLLGLRCRLAVLAHRSSSTKSDKRGLKERLEIARLAEIAANSISRYDPLRRSRDFDDERARVHTQACRALMIGFDGVRALPAEGPLADERKTALGRFGRDEKGIGYAACACMSRSVELLPPDAPTAIRGGLQSELTSRGCFLDDEKVRADRGGPTNTFSGHAADVAAESSVEHALSAYAESRAFELKRCTLKHAPLGRVKNLKAKEKLAKCACRSVERWRFPADKGRAPVSFDVVLGKKLRLQTKVAPNGRVDSCGPLR